MVTTPSNIAVAVTIDDLPTHGPAAGSTRLAIAQGMLEALRRHSVPEAYGFANGKWLEQNGEAAAVMREWVRAGHPLGNHTYSHLDLNECTPDDFMEDVLRNEPILDTCAPSADTKFLRYPYLSEGDTPAKRRHVRASLAAAGYRIAQVTIDFKDWAWNEPYARLANGDDSALAWLRASFLESAVEYLRFADALGQRLAGRRIAHVLLLHIGAFDAVMLDDLLAAYEAEGVRFIDLRTALSDEIYETDSNVALRVGESWLHQLAIDRNVPFPPLVEAPRARLASL